MSTTAHSPRDIGASYAIVRSVDGFGRLHEEAIRAAYESVLSEGDSAIDGGAHSGKHTLPMAAAVGATGQVLAFEPSPGPFAKLEAAINAQPLSQVRAVCAAVSREPQSSQRFLVFADRPGVSGFERRTDAAGELPADEIVVTTTTIDSYADQLGPTRFIKLDVEGAELDALFGARRVIAEYLPVIHIEASYISWDAFGYGPTELLDFCREFDYDLVDIIATPLTSVAEVDQSFRTPSVWDYALIPPTSSGATALSALTEFSANHYGL